MRRRLLCSLLRFVGASIASSGAASAWAAEARVVVTEGGAPIDPSCPDTYSVTERVRALRPNGLAFGTGDAAPRLAITFVRLPDGAFSAVVRASAPIEGERSLSDQGKGCSALGEAVAVTIALLLDGVEEGGAPQGPPSRDEPPAASRPSAQLFLGAGFATAAVAAWAPRFAGELAFHPTSRARAVAPELGAGFVYVPAVDAALGPGTVATSAAFGTLRAGIRFGIGTSAPGGSGSRVAIVPSLQLLVGSVRAEGSGFSEDRAQSRAFARAGLALPLVWQVTPSLALRLVGEGDVAFRRQRFVVDAVPSAAEVPRIGGSLSVGVGLSLF